MGSTTTVNGIPYPVAGDANNVPSDMAALANAIDGGSVNKRLTQTQINALTAPQKPAGLVVYNTTINRTQVSNGTTFDSDLGLGVWADYTPAVTGWTLGNGTVTGRKMIIGKTCQWRIKLTLGTTTVVNADANGVLILSLPVAGVSPDAVTAGVQSGLISDVSNNTIFPIVAYGRPTNAALLNVCSIQSDSMYASAGGLGTTYPFTWAATDWITVGGCHEIA